MKDNLSSKLNQAFEDNMLKEELSPSEKDARLEVFDKLSGLYMSVQEINNDFNKLDKLATNLDSTARFRFENLAEDFSQFAANFEKYLELLEEGE